MRRVAGANFELALGLAMLMAAKPRGKHVVLDQDTHTLPPSEPRVRKFTDARKAEKSKRKKRR